ncbi:NOP protein chaperone 1-like [Daphnia carinata]|uniref:NOP protein chaperone 1-like n=1 Tax=Daphnia carinata TaxID=120202 RepID=UPI002580DE83|nr:NOP protein chaperone 1-like [Daphnia carinata]
MTSEAKSQSDILKPKHSKALLGVEGIRQKTKESVVFSLLKEKKRSGGTFKIAPSSSLQKVKEFLPHLRSANIKMQEELKSDPNKQTKYDIQNLDEESGRIIEMDLALYEDTDSDCSISSEDMRTEANNEVIDENNIKFPGGNFKSNLVQVIEKDQVEQENITIPV